MALTAKQVEQVRPTERTQKLFDGGGMYLEVTPAGGKRWRLKYRYHGREKLISLGVYPEISLKEARVRREDARRLLARGVDPSAERQARRRAQAAETFEAVAREWFAGQRPTWAESHATRVIRRLERDVFPYLGRAPPAEITAPEVLQVLRRIENRGALDTAHRALQNIGQVMRYAVATGRALRDASADLRGALPPVAGGHFPAVTEPNELGPLLRAMDAYTGHPTTQAALRLAPLLFVRPRELRYAEWSEVALEDALWTVPAAKVKASDIDHLVPLARQAVEIIAELRPLTGEGRYLFPSLRSRDRPMSSGTITAAFRRMGYAEGEVSHHGFRATARTLLDEVLGCRPDWIEHQLAHAVRDPNGRAYNRTAFLSERREMMQRWANYLDGLRGT